LFHIFIAMKALKIFENKKIRSFWNEEQEKWYFSIIDVIEALTNTDRPRKYWNDLKAKLIKEGIELSHKIGQLKIQIKEWENKGVKKGQEFATLTDIITQAWSGNTVKQYKEFKGLKKENLRDNMTNLELVLNMLAEATTTEISKENNPKTFDDNKAIAKKGGEIAGNTRKQIEQQTGKKIISPLNAKILKEAKENKKLK
jgi:hypothetical protein